MSENKAKKLDLNDKEQFFVNQAIATYQVKFGTLSIKDKTVPFTLKTVIEYYHDNVPMSPAIHELKKSVFAKLDAFAGTKVKTFNELLAEEDRDRILKEVEANKARVKSLKELVGEREVVPGTISFTSEKLPEFKLEAKKKEKVVKKEFKPGIKSEEKLIYSLDDVLDGL